MIVVHDDRALNVKELLESAGCVCVHSDDAPNSPLMSNPDMFLFLCPYSAKPVNAIDSYGFDSLGLCGEYPDRLAWLRNNGLKTPIVRAVEKGTELDGFSLLVSGDEKDILIERRKGIDFVIEFHQKNGRIFNTSIVYKIGGVS